MHKSRILIHLNKTHLTNYKNIKVSNFVKKHLYIFFFILRQLHTHFHYSIIQVPNLRNIKIRKARHTSNPNRKEENLTLNFFNELLFLYFFY